MAGIVDAARAAKILGARWEKDPLRVWIPNERQQMFLDSEKPEVAILGANRSGKSDALAALVASFARFGNPNPRTSFAMGGRLQITDRAVSIWVIGLTERLIREGIQPKIIHTAHTAAETHPAFIPPVEVNDYNLNDQTWRLKNGSIIAFKSADAGAGVFQSAGRELVAFDEICDWDVYKEATFRVPGGDRRLMIRLAATLLPPVGVPGGVSWYYPQKIKPWWASGNKENQSSNPHRFLDIYTMGIRHNRHINREEIARLEEMFPPGSMEARIRLDGELLASIGGTLAYTGFNRLIHIDHTCVPERLDFRVPLRLCVDFNVAPCVWVIGQKIGEQWRFFDEIKMSEANVPDMTREFRDRYPTHGSVVYIHGDQTGSIRNAQTGKSHYWLIQEGLRGYPVPVRLMLPKKNPAVSDRLNAVNRAFSGSDGRVRLVMGPQMTETIADCEEVLRDPRGGIKKTHHPDNPYWERTHAMDCVGYAVCYEDPVPQIDIAEPSSNSKLKKVATPQYLRRGPNVTKSPDEYKGRLRRGEGGGVLPPTHPWVK